MILAAFGFVLLTALSGLEAKHPEFVYVSRVLLAVLFLVLLVLALIGSPYAKA